MYQKIFSGKTDVGLKRENNEDAFIVSPEMDFCLAADGMGGAAAGELASRIFVDTALEIFSKNTNHSEEQILFLIQKAFSFANEKILEHVTKNPEHEGMGCTAELLAFSDDGFVLGHVGDSRTYRVRNGFLEQLTEDHTLVQQQLDEGLIAHENVRNHPLRHVILRAIGLTHELTLDLVQGKIAPGDLFLLCSDGLTDMVPNDQIRDILNSDVDINQKAGKMIEAAKTAGGDDNITVVLAAII
ncbi:MAG: Stp1/IreP family PP2C-type Ser/Thr phosphatase [Deltaproteobacteria bacterium]|nr:Stp1/IreP family PP2C-type Ser/Thr phosphatase [Deltaproteobacteria bacterium]